MLDHMRYFRLDPDEWDRLDDLMALHGKTAPPPQVASAIVAESEHGQIVGAAFFMLAYHFENLVALPKSGISVTELHKVLDSHLYDVVKSSGTPITYYSNVMDNERALDAARRNGMEGLTGFIPHSKTIRP